MKYPVLRQIEAYWDGLRAGRPVPLRSEIDPRGIDGALEYAFILERIAPGLARFRLAGMHLVDLMGMEVRGMPLTSFFVPESRRTVSDVLEQVFEGPETVEMTLSGERGIGKPPIEAKLLMLPLKSDLGDVSRVLGCLVSDGAIGRSPRRFHLTECRRSQIENFDRGARKPEKTPTPGFAEPATPFSNKKPGRKGPVLRLIRTDD